MKIGIYPAAIQDAFGVHIGRRVVYASLWKSGTAYTDEIILNVDNSPFHRYTKDAALFAERVVKIYNALQPVLISIENEELLTGDIKTYCNELTAAANALPGKIVNGGLTLPELSYWYWNQTQDDDFFRDNIPLNQKDGLLAGLKAETIDKIAYELNVIKGLQMPYVNVHYYFKYAGQVPGLVRMFNYLSQFVGKPVISNEAGMYEPGILPLVVDVARQCSMDWLILYSGPGGEGAQVITKIDFENVST